MPRFRPRPASLATEDVTVGARRMPGSSVVTATLPNGRAAWFRLDPAPVPVTQINRLAAQTHAADLRHAKRTRTSAQSIRRLSRTLGRDIERLNAARLRGDATVAKRITAGDAKIETKITSALGRAGAGDTKAAKLLVRATRRIRRRAVWDSAVIASAAPLFAAYGQQDRPLGQHNVTLAAALGVWLLGDEITDLISGRPDDPPTLVRDVDLWSYMAPFGNLLAGWWLMRDGQHHRFVTGIAPELLLDDVVVADLTSKSLLVKYRYELNLADERIAAGYANEFMGFVGVPSTAVLAEGTLSNVFDTSPPFVSSAVVAGVLVIEVHVVVRGRKPAPAPPVEAGEVAPVAPEVIAPSEGDASGRRSGRRSPTPVAIAAPAVALPPAEEALRIERFDRAFAIMKERGDEVSDDQRTARAHLADAFNKLLWTTLPKVAWLVDTQKP